MRIGVLWSDAQRCRIRPQASMWSAMSSASWPRVSWSGSARVPPAQTETSMLTGTPLVSTSYTAERSRDCSSTRRSSPPMASHRRRVQPRRRLTARAAAMTTRGCRAAVEELDRGDLRTPGEDERAGEPAGDGRDIRLRGTDAYHRPLVGHDPQQPRRHGPRSRQHVAPAILRTGRVGGSGAHHRSVGRCDARLFHGPTVMDSLTGSLENAWRGSEESNAGPESSHSTTSGRALHESRGRRRQTRSTGGGGGAQEKRQWSSVPAFR